MSSSTNTVKKLSRKGSKMGCSTMRQYSAISEHSSIKGTPQAIREWLMLSLPDFPANHSQSPESEQEKTTAATSGPKHLPYFAQYDRDTRCWRTSQVSWLTHTLDEYSGTWPKAGSMRTGACYPQPSAERRISATGSGFIATPTGGGERSKARAGTGSLAYMARAGQLDADAVMSLPLPADDTDALTVSEKWPTPAARDWKGGRSPEALAEMRETSARGVGLDTAVKQLTGGQLNPGWVEWLMGWPIGWTGLKPLETDKFRQWLEQHGNY